MFSFFKFNLLIFCVLMSNISNSADKNFIDNFCSSKTKHPFNYNLNVKILKSYLNNASYMICCHGYGANNEIVDILKFYDDIKDNLVSFNFPDHDIKDSDDHNLSVYGSIKEILPAIYVIKNLVIDGKLNAINLYGFSAGGGALINILSVLSNSLYDKDLENIGVNSKDKEIILKVIQKGLVILDCPLKSIEEIMVLRGRDKNLEILAKNYKKNNFRPIDSIKTFNNLKLNILLHFQMPDEILSNRDDKLFSNLLKKYNLGQTHIVIGKEGGHNSYHKSLWQAYKKLINK